MKINWVDILIVIYIIRAFFLGKKRGLSYEITALISALFAWVTALHFYQDFGESLSKWFLLTIPTARIIAFILIGIGVLFLGAIAARLLKKIMKLSFVPNVEKIGGCILGTLRGISISAMIIVTFALIPANFVQREVYLNSFLGNYLVALSPKIHKWIWPKDSEGYNKFDIGKFWSQLPERPKEEIL